MEKPTPGDHLNATYDGGHYDHGEVIMVHGGRLVVAFYDFTAESEWLTRLFLLPVGKLEKNASDELTFAIEDCKLADVVQSADDQRGESVVVEPQFLRQTVN